MSCPALVAALALLAGVGAGALAPLSAPPLLSSLVALFLAAVLALRARKSRAFLAAIVCGFAVAGAILGADEHVTALNPALAQTLLDPAHKGVLSAPVLVEGRLRQDAAPSAGGVTLRLSATRIFIDGGWHEAAHGGLIVGVNGSLGRERLEEWRAGRTLRLPVAVREASGYRDPGVPDQVRSLARRGTRFVGSVKSPALVEQSAAASWASERAADARGWARGAIGRAVGRWSGQSAAIVIAILIGDRAGLDDDMERKLQEAGTYHVIAISGGNIAILAGLLLGVLKVARIRGRLAFALAALLLMAYAGLVGGGSSVTRATLMAVTYLAARAGDHRTPPMNALAVSAGLILCVSPFSVFDPGFALTFGATIGILVGGRRLASRLPRAWWVRVPAALLLASLSAELALLPIAAYAFSRVTFAGLFLNFLAIPLMTLAQVAGMAALLLSPFAATLAAGAGYLAHVGAWGLVASARWVDLAPWLTWRVPAPAVAVIAIYYAGWLSWLGWSRPAGSAAWSRLRRVGSRCGLVLVLVGGLWVLVSPVGRLRGLVPTGRLRVTFLDVGAGDAILVRFPDARTLLVDTGGLRIGSFDIGGRVLAPALWALDVYGLDWLAISHADPDHIGGAAAIVRDFRPREIWEGVPVPRDAGLQALQQEAKVAGAGWRTLFAGERLDIAGVRLRVLHPPAPDWERQQVRNDDSLVFDLRFGDVSVLLTGDIGRDVERELAAHLEAAPLRVLKVPHHGSASSSSPGFLAAARPALAVLSARPAAAGRAALEGVLRRYHEAGINVFRTDQDGAVTIDTDGRSLTARGMDRREMTLNATKDTKNSLTTKSTKLTKGRALRQAFGLQVTCTTKDTKCLVNHEEHEGHEGCRLPQTGLQLIRTKDTTNPSPRRTRRTR